jgi:hypothetical protein
MFNKSIHCARHQYLISVIPATWKAGIGKITAQSQLLQIVSKSPPEPITECSGTCLSSQGTQEADILMPGKKIVCENPSQWKKTGCDGICLSTQQWWEAKNRRITV